MKSLQILFLIVCLSASAFGQEKNAVKPPPDPDETSYCALLKDGALIVVAEGKQVYQDIKLNGGFVIKSNAMLVNDEGKETPLMNGDCVRMDGKIIKNTEVNKKIEQ